MKNLKLYTCFLVIFTLIFSSCSTEEEGLKELQNEKATLSLGALLSDLDISRAAMKQAVGDIPACSDDDVVYVEIVLSSGGVDIVGTSGNPFRVDLVAGQLFTEEVAELELEPGSYSLDYFSVHAANGDVLWVAPIAGSSLAPWVDNALPLAINLQAGVKKYIDVSVLCFDDRLVNEYGYLFFQLDATQAIQFCVFGNYCDDTGRHYPAAYSVNVWSYANGQQGAVLYSNVTNTVAANSDGDYASSPVCFALPDTAGEDQYYFEITLLNSDAYGTVTERIIRQGVISDDDVRDLHIGEDDSDYYHFRAGCGGTDTPGYFSTPGTRNPVIDRDTEIYIYFDSSGSMNSTLSPLQQMRSNLLKDALLPLYDNDEDLYNERVQVLERPSERTFHFLNVEGAAQTGNIIALVFQDEAHEVYHGYYQGWDSTTARTGDFESDITELRARLNTFAADSYSGVIFQVDNPFIVGTHFKNLMQYVESGTGNYAGNYGLADRDEIGFVYDVEDGNSQAYYRDLILDALRDLGYQL